MSFLKLQKKKAQINGLAKRVEEFIDGAGKIYQEAQNGGNNEILRVSLTMKLRAGELLREEIAQCGEQEADRTTQLLLGQLSTTISNELLRLHQLQRAISDLEIATREERVIAESETLRKLRLETQKFAGKGEGTE